MSTNTQAKSEFDETYEAILTAYEKSAQAESVRNGSYANPDPGQNIESGIPSSTIPRQAALQKCQEAYASAKSEAETQNKSLRDVNELAGAAFCRAMPPLRGRANIREFIDCVAHGMLINAIPANQGSKLLYAAQVAFTATNGAKKTKNRPNTPQTVPTVYDWLKKQFPKNQ